MAIAFDTNVGQQVSTGVTSQTYSHTCTGSNLLLVVGIEGNTTDTITGVTYNGVAMTKATNSVLGSGSSRWEYIFYLLNPATGANNIVISSSASTNIVSASASYTGVGSLDNTFAGTNVTSTTITTTGTVNTTNSWLIAFATIYGTATAGSGTTIRNANPRFIMDSNSALATGSRSLIFTQGASEPASVLMLSFAPPLTANGNFLAFMS